MSRFLPLMAALAAAALVGCSDSSSEVSAAMPRPPKFEGKVDSRFVGSWRNANGSATAQLLKDGSMKAESITYGVNGKAVSDVAGQWLVNGKDLLMRYPDKAGLITLSYSATLKGDQLTLVQNGNKLKTVYHKER